MLRGGYGIFYQPPFVEAYNNMVDSAPFSPQMQRFGVNFSNPYAGIHESVPGPVRAPAPAAGREVPDPDGGRLLRHRLEAGAAAELEPDARASVAQRPAGARRVRGLQGHSPRLQHRRQRAAHLPRLAATSTRKTAGPTRISSWSRRTSPAPTRSTTRSSFRSTSASRTASRIGANYTSAAAWTGSRT